MGLEEIEKFLRFRVNIQDLRRSSNTMQARMIDKDSVKTLIEKASSGNRDAFEELLRRHKDRLEALIALRMGPALRQKVDLEDVYQETLARAYRNIDGLRDMEGRKFLGWLGQMAEYVILNLARRHERRRTLPLDSGVSGEHVSPSRGLRRSERFERLKEALDRMSSDHREVILLSRIEGLKLREIADRMQRSIPAVAQLLSRALRKLRDEFGETESFHLPDRRLGETERGIDGQGES